MEAKVAYSASRRGGSTKEGPCPDVAVSSPTTCISGQNEACPVPAFGLAASTTSGPMAMADSYTAL